MGKKNKINSPKKPNTLVKNNTEPVKELPINFDFSDGRWLSSVKMKDFTNFVDKAEDCLNAQYNIFCKIIPKVIDEWESIKTTFRQKYPYPHCHSCEKDKHNKVREIFEEIYKYKLDEEVKIYQFSFTGATRLICIFDSIKNILRPIFIDYNHLIYPNPNYNQPDFKKFDYCMRCAHK